MQDSLSRRTSQKENQLPEDLLTGAKGIVYLMFLERSTTAFDVGKRLVKIGIIDKEATIYQYVPLLAKAELLDREPGKGRGGAKETKASSSKFLAALREPPYNVSQQEIIFLHKLLVGLDGILDVFPCYLKEVPDLHIETLSWKRTQSLFFTFLIMASLGCASLLQPAYRKMLSKKENLDPALPPETDPETLEQLAKLLRSTVGALQSTLEAVPKNVRKQIVALVLEPPKPTFKNPKILLLLRLGTINMTEDPAARFVLSIILRSFAAKGKLS